MVLVRILKFLWCLPLGTFLLEKVLGYVLYRKPAFLDHKNINLKMSQKISIFLKGLVHGFCEKFQIGLFSLCKQIWPTHIVWWFSI